MKLSNGVAEDKPEPGTTVLQGLVRERRQPQQSRLAKLLIANADSASLQPTIANDLDELDEEDVWEAAGCYVGGGATVKRNSNPNLLRIVPAERNGAAVWGIGASIIRQRSLEKDPGVFVLAAGKMNVLSSTSPQESGSKSPSDRRSIREGTPRRAPPTASRMIPRGALMEETGRRAAQHQSVPMNIPDWSKILKLEKVRKAPADISDDDREGEDQERLPPHELLSREYAKSQVYSFSVFEGVGRTLRGRDLSRVRNAILTRTGFLE